MVFVMKTSEISLSPPESETALLLECTLGHIRGKIVDKYGTAIVESIICIRETNQIAHTDKNGNFTIINIEPSVYTITIECTGYSPCQAFDIPIKTGDNPGFRFVLHMIQ
jgi:hypothetical protein